MATAEPPFNAAVDTTMAVGGGGSSATLLMADRVAKTEGRPLTEVVVVMDGRDSSRQGHRPSNHRGNLPLPGTLGSVWVFHRHPLHRGMETMGEHPTVPTAEEATISTRTTGPRHQGRIRSTAIPTEVGKEVVGATRAAGAMVVDAAAAAEVEVADMAAAAIITDVSRGVAVRYECSDH